MENKTSKILFQEDSPSAYPLTKNGASSEQKYLEYNEHTNNELINAKIQKREQIAKIIREDIHGPKLLCNDINDAPTYNIKSIVSLAKTQVNLNDPTLRTEEYATSINHTKTINSLQDIDLEEPPKTIGEESYDDTSLLANQPAKAQIQLDNSQISIPRKIGLLTKRIGVVNKNFNTFPNFYKKELRRSLFISIIWVAIFIASIISAVTLCLIAAYSNLAFTKVVVPMLSIIGVFSCLGLLFLYSLRYKLFHDEALSVDFSESKPVTINVLKTYKLCKIGHIKANWMCGLTYVVSLLSILLLIFVSLGIGKGASYPFVAGNNPYFYAFFSFMLAITIALLLHIYIAITNYWRGARIENYYSQYIVPQDEILQLKKKVNRKYMIIFAVSLIIVTGFIFLIYKLIMFIVKRKTTVITTK